MRKSPVFGRYYVGCFYIGIVRHQGSLWAEFGPRRFQQRGDQSISTLLLSLEELQDVIADEPNIPLQPAEKLFYLSEIKIALHDFKGVMNGLERNLIDPEKFFKPERAVNMAVVIGQMPTTQFSFQRLFNTVVQNRMDECGIELPYEYIKIRDTFDKNIFADDGLNQPENRKPLPPIEAPKPPQNNL